MSECNDVIVMVLKTDDEDSKRPKGTPFEWALPLGGPMAMFDKNSDGKLSREEFLKGQGDLFDQLDYDNDGVLSAEERLRRGPRDGRCPPGDMPLTPPPPQGAG